MLTLSTMAMGKETPAQAAKSCSSTHHWTPAKFCGYYPGLNQIFTHTTTLSVPKHCDFRCYLIWARTDSKHRRKAVQV